MSTLTIHRAAPCDIKEMVIVRCENNTDIATQAAVMIMIIVLVAVVVDV